MAMAMTSSKRDLDQIDRLSILPEDILITILSFLPTPVAARTSVLCRRFRYLWEASPSLQLTPRDLPHSYLMNFIQMGERAILLRNSSHPIISLYLELCHFKPPLPDHYIYFLLVKAHSLGLRDLTIDGPHDLVQLILPIFSIDSLTSLSLPTVGPIDGPIFHNYCTYTFNCPKLRNLSLRLFRVGSFNVSKLLSELSSLEDLHLEIHAIDSLCLSSKTIINLKLLISAGDPKFDNIELFLPLLESLHLETRGSFSGQCPMIHGEVPVLKKAVIILDEVRAEDVNAVWMMLNTISHVEELSLHVKEEKYPIPISILLEPGKDMPNFPNLKHLDASFCFHERNFEAIIVMVRNCPALESLKLVHKILKFTDWAQGKKERDWISELPHNSNGNCRYALFTNLHLGNNRKEFMNLLERNMPLYETN